MIYNRLTNYLFTSVLFVVPFICLGLGWVVWHEVASSRPPSDRYQFTHETVRYDTPSEGPFAVTGTECRDVDYGDVPSYSDDGLWQMAGHLYYRGHFYGSVYPNQTVFITDTGGVFINGKERLPCHWPYKGLHRSLI